MSAISQNWEQITANTLANQPDLPQAIRDAVTQPQPKNGGMKIGNIKVANDNGFGVAYAKQHKAIREQASKSTDLTIFAEYLVAPIGSDYEGWFPYGELSLIAGSSGTGKTTIMIRVLDRISRGESVFGHLTTKRNYRIIFHDRSAKSFKRFGG